MNGPIIRFKFRSERHCHVMLTDGAFQLTGFELRQKICERYGLWHRTAGYVHLFRTGGEPVADNDLIPAYSCIIAARNPQPWDCSTQYPVLRGATPPPAPVAAPPPPPVASHLPAAAPIQDDVTTGAHGTLLEAIRKFQAKQERRAKRKARNRKRKEEP